MAKAESKKEGVRADAGMAEGKPEASKVVYAGFWRR